MRPLLAELERSQYFPPERLRAEQWTRLARLLEHAYTHAPYYREQFKRQGLHPRDLRALDDLSALPPLTKETVRDCPGDLLADDVTGPLVERRTSGSTGIPLVVSVYPHTRNAWSAAARRGHRWWGVDLGSRQIKLINPRGKSRRTKLKQQWLMNRAEYSVFELDEPTLERLYREAVRFRCEVLAGYPSALTHFAHYAAERGLRQLRLRAIFSTAEVLYPDQRALLEQTFGCPVINEYGASECGFLAGECREGRLHITAENAVIEFEPLDGGDGEARGLLITDLTNTAMPLIRYRVGDLGAPGEPCPCGRGLPVLDLRVGRTEDLVTLPDGRKVDGAIFGETVEALITRGAAIKQFRAIQHDRGHIEVLVATGDSDGRVAEDLTERLQAVLGRGMTITVRAVERIPVEPTGKLRRFVSHLDGRSS
ncbi:MAG: phenylacetate--CoA ligase family protein [bacterium]